MAWTATYILLYPTASILSPSLSFNINGHNDEELCRFSKVKKISKTNPYPCDQGYVTILCFTLEDSYINYWTSSFNWNIMECFFLFFFLVSRVRPFYTLLKCSSHAKRSSCIIIFNESLSHHIHECIRLDDVAVKFSIAMHPYLSTLPWLCDSFIELFHSSIFNKSQKWLFEALEMNSIIHVGTGILAEQKLFAHGQYHKLSVVKSMDCNGSK